MVFSAATICPHSAGLILTSNIFTPAPQYIRVIP
jgi:hypothetical protein